MATVIPDDYPKDVRAGVVADTPLDEEKEDERLNAGGGGKTPAVPGRRYDRDNA